jgi:hypothetical protein
VLIVIPQIAAIGDLAGTLILIWADDKPDEWKNLAAKSRFERGPGPWAPIYLIDFSFKASA